MRINRIIAPLSVRIDKTYKKALKVLNTPQPIHGLLPEAFKRNKDTGLTNSEFIELVLLNLDK